MRRRFLMSEVNLYIEEFIEYVQLDDSGI